jgi:hypothetical protein
LTDGERNSLLLWVAQVIEASIERFTRSQFVRAGRTGKVSYEGVEWERKPGRAVLAKAHRSE